MIYDFELDGYPAPVDSRHEPVRWSRGGLAFMRWSLVLACGLFLLGFLSPSVSHCGEAMRRAQCVNNLKQIQLAIENYHEKYGAFPPAYVADSNGCRLHSWRVLILPFLDVWPPRKVEYDFSEPWDGPHNIRLLDETPSVFECPSQSPRLKGGTSYVAITGPGTMFPGSASVRRTEIKDGLDDTLSVVEVDNLPIPWTAPLDLDVRTMSFEINDPRRPSIGSPHPGGAIVSTGDDRVRSMKEGISPDRLRAMTTIDGGEPIEQDNL